MDALLEELCTRHGWCLREDDRNALIADPPREREAVAMLKGPRRPSGL